MPNIPWVVRCSGCSKLHTVPIKPAKGFLCSPCVNGLGFINAIYGDMGLTDPMAEDTSINPTGGFVGIND
jgi:hypothetical protein